jgi:hypothetical protein
MLKMVDGTGIIGVDMICPLGVSTPQPPNYDKVEMEGAGILVLPNSLNAPLERLELGGKTEQVQTTGAQLLKPKDGSYTVFGVSVDIANGEIKLSGTATSSGGRTIRLSEPFLLKAGTYSSEVDGKIDFILSKNSDNSYLVNLAVKNFNVNEDTEVYVGLNVMAQNTYNNKYHIMLNSGNIPLPYEPYAGGKPSPSPEYPQEIKNSGKWNEEKQKYEVDVKITGKNLFDMNKFIDTCNFTKNEDGTFRIDKYVERYDCFIPANTILSIEVLKVEDSSGAAALELFYEDGKSMYIGFGQVGVKTFLIQKDVAYIKVLAYRKHEYKYIQLEKGRTATPYEPYKEQTLTLTSDRPITKWDRLVEQGGQIGWLYNSANETIDGKTGKWSIQPASKIFYRTDITFPIAVPFCSELLGYDYSSVGYKKDTGITINNLGILCITLPEEVELTPDAYKQYLADNPLHVLYKGDSEEFVPLPEEEQNAIRALKTYYPTTVITVDGGELDPDIKVTYRKEK